MASPGAPKSNGRLDNLFPLRSKSVRLTGSLGVGPLKLLELRCYPNQSGTMSYMLVFEISRLYRCIGHLRHNGNLGPKRHDLSTICLKLEGGTQVDFAEMEIELSDNQIVSKLANSDK